MSSTSCFVSAIFDGVASGTWRRKRRPRSSRSTDARCASRRAARRPRSGAGVAWADVRRVALEVKALLEELGLVGWPKTSGSRGFHVLVRIDPRWSFEEVRRAALALSREIERRAPKLAT